MLVSGGSAANLTALACARESPRRRRWRDDLVAYVSDQTHSSFARAARNLGFRPEQVRVLPVDERLSAAHRPARRRDGGGSRRGATAALRLRERRRDEHRSGRSVARARGRSAVSGAPGSTSTPRTEASPCSPSAGREQLAGLERADSITLDPHKWLYQPYECGCLLVRDGAGPAKAPSRSPRTTCSDAIASAGEVNFSDLGMQLTRTSRALKIWVSIRYFGLDAFRAGDRAHARPRRRRQRPHRGRATSSSCWRRRRSGSSASGGVSAGSTTRRRSSG